MSSLRASLALFFLLMDLDHDVHMLQLWRNILPKEELLRVCHSTGKRPASREQSDSSRRKRRGGPPQQAKEEDVGQQTLITLMAKLILRHEDTLHTLLLEHRYWQSSVKSQSLRHCLAHHLFKTLVDRAAAILTAKPGEEVFQVGLEQNLITKEEKFPFLMWCHQSRELTLSKDQPVERMDLQQIPWLLTTSTPMFQVLQKLCFYSIWLLVAVDLKKQSLNRSPLAKQIDSRLYQALRVCLNPQGLFCWLSATSLGLCWPGLVCGCSKDSWRLPWLFDELTRFSPQSLTLRFGDSTFHQMLSERAEHHLLERQQDVADFLAYCLPCLTPDFYSAEWLPQWAYRDGAVLDDHQEKETRFAPLMFHVTDPNVDHNLQSLVNHWHDENGHVRLLRGCPPGTCIHLNRLIGNIDPFQNCRPIDIPTHVALPCFVDEAFQWQSRSVPVGWKEKPTYKR